MRRISSAAPALVLLALAGGAFAADPKSPVEPPPVSGNVSAPEGRLPQYGPFVIEEALEPRVRFWVDIYARYNSWEMVLHHLDHPDIVYAVVNTRGNPNGVKKERDRIRKLLLRLHDRREAMARGKLKVTDLPADERKFFEKFSKVEDTERFRKAAEISMIRGQAGLRDRLIDALYVSGRYLPRMEKVFERFNLPGEIAYLPFVESGFNKQAKSKVGASGIWQFMPETGKLFLRVDDVVDERNDPMRAAEAAARLMTQNYDILKEWPLAVTAYNHGALGMARAVKDTGSTSLAKIIEKYEGKTFGFASSNFYASFLAALEVGKNYEKYIGEVAKARKLEFDEFVMTDFVSFQTLLEFTGVDEKEFRELNPALSSAVYRGELLIPVGYTVRVPMDDRGDFLQRYEKIPSHLKFKKQRGGEPVSADPPPPATVPSGEVSGSPE